MDKVKLSAKVRSDLLESFARDYMHKDSPEFVYGADDFLKLYALFEHPAVAAIEISIDEIEDDDEVYDHDPVVEMPENLTLRYVPKTSFKKSSNISKLFKDLIYIDGNKWATRDGQVLVYSCEWVEVRNARTVIIVLTRMGAKVVPVAMTADKDDMVYEKIDDDVAGMLFTWFAIVQYGLYNRPTVVAEKREVTNIPARKSKYGKNKKRAKRIVNVVRHISFGEIEHKAGTHTMVCPAWGVMGHYRHYKDGKVVWIKPYTKGKMRDLADKYEDKEYVFRTQTEDEKR